MARVGQTIVQPLSGERLTFLETAATTGGDLLKMSIEMAPNGAVAMAHIHPQAAEEFEVQSGRIQFTSAKTTRTVEAGERVLVPPGVDHVWGNPFDTPATVTVSVRPALKLETFFETVFGLAADGKLNTKTQRAGLLQTVLILHAYRNEVTLPGVAGIVMRVLGGVLAPVARARGYRERYPQYSDPDSP